ncbi:MAG: peptide deformylase [Verrucomicrobiae bacterium]|nr:peptide deformylase [Verrucomicrobiae bacterium]
MIREIVLYGDPVLRRKGDRVTSVTPEIRQLAEDMIETMIDARGVGLAAPQVGESLQLAVVDVSHDPECISYLRVNGEECAIEDISPLVFINPELKGSRETETDVEGCLSFPDLRGDITRPAEIKARLETLDGNILEIEADGLLARAIQHEVDHLMGKLFIDRMSRARKLSLKRTLREMQRDWESQRTGW